MCKVKGLGIDLCAVSRMEPLVAQGRFVDRYFTPEEAAYIAGKGRGAAQTMAGMFAAKEAALKAMGCGIVVPLREVEIVHDAAGQPGCVLHGEAARRGEGCWQVSITHEGDMAAAVCLWMA